MKSLKDMPLRDIWKKLLLRSCILVIVTTSVWCQKGTNHQQQQQFQQQPIGSTHGQQPLERGRHGPRSMDRKTVQDKQHLKEHLDGQINSEKKMSDEEMQFHYFKVHDYDNNNMLDGIELIKAMTHHHGDEEDEQMTTIPDDELSEMINDILRDLDSNLDGYIDYPEFVTSQRQDIL